MKTLRILLLSAAVAGIAGAAQAQNVAVGAHVGTTGVGAEAFFRLNDHLVVRGGGDWGKYNRDLNSNDIDYDGEAEWKTFNLGVDLHPLANPLFVTAGFYAGDRKVNVDAVSARNVTISGTVFTPAQIGTISGEASLSDSAPFLGIGFDNTFYGDRSWGVRAMAGVAFSDDPDVKLTANGPFASQAVVQSYLRSEEQQIRDDADFFKTYPVLSIGANFRF